MSRPRRVLGIAAVAAVAVAGAGIGWALSCRAGRRRSEVAAGGLPGIVVHGSGVVIATGGSVVQQGVGGKGVASTGSTSGGTSSVGCAPEDGAIWTLDPGAPAGSVAPSVPALPVLPAALRRPAAAALPAGRARPWSGLLPTRPFLPCADLASAGPVPPRTDLPPAPDLLDPAAARRARVSHPSRTAVPAPRPALGPGRSPGRPEVLRAADRWARLPWWSGAGAEPGADGPVGSALLDAGLEDHSVLVCGDGNLVGADDSAVVVDRDGPVVVSTGDVDSAGVSLVDAVATVVDASGSGEERAAADADGDGQDADPEDGAAGDGVDDVSLRVLGSRNVVVQDDGVVVAGGSGPVSAQIGDSDTGGVLALHTVGTRVVTDARD